MKYFIVIDMQNDFCTGALANKDAVAIIPYIREKLIEFIKKEKENGTVIFTRDTHGSDYLETLEGKNLPVPHCIRDTEGWQIVPELAEVIDKYKSTVKIIDKNRFGYDKWYRLLEPFSDVIMVGTCTDICVISNALGIKALPDMNVTVLEKGCAGLTKAKHDAAIETLRSCQCNIQ